MISSLVPALISAFKARRELALENVALRQQLAVLRRSVKRPRLSKVDRVFWVLLRRIWTDWEASLSKNTNELKTGAPGRFDRHRLRSEPQIWGVSEAMSAIRVPRTRRENTIQQRGCHAPGRRPGSRPGPHLDQNVLARYAADSPGLDSGNSRVASFPTAARPPVSGPLPPFGANVALENRD